MLAVFFFFQAEDGIRDFHVTGVQTCALPIYDRLDGHVLLAADDHQREVEADAVLRRIDRARHARLTARDAVQRRAIEREAALGDVEEAVDEAVERARAAQRLDRLRDALRVLDPHALRNGTPRRSRSRLTRATCVSNMG